MQDKAIQLANEIYKITCTFNPVGNIGEEEKEIENYANMIEERGPLVKSLVEILKDLQSIPEELKTIVENIRQKDNQDNIFFDTIKNTLLHDLKEVRDGQKLNNAYYAQDWEGASSFSIRQ